MAGRKVGKEALCDVLELGTGGRRGCSRWSAPELRMGWGLDLEEGRGEDLQLT